jgi:hypothetical protein
MLLTSIHKRERKIMNLYIVIISWKDKKDEHISVFLEQGNLEQAKETAKRRLPAGSQIFLVNTKIVSQESIGLLSQSTF